MKKATIILLITAMLLSLAGCGGKETPETSGNTVRLGGIKGPSSMGMVKLLSDNEQGKTQNQYEWTMAGAADELTGKLLKGELDILAVPANLGSVLYAQSKGAVSILAIDMLGALYVVEKGGETVSSIRDLKGKTIYTIGKGSTPEYVLSYLLKENGLDMETDVSVTWYNDGSEAVASLATKEEAIAMLPQPFVTVAEGKIPDLRVALDLNAEWEDLGDNGKFITGAIIVNTAFAANNPELIKIFLQEYAASTEYVNTEIEAAAALIEKYDIVTAEIAKKALPACNIVCITGDAMKQAMLGYLNVLYEQNPASVGGALPGDDFFLNYES